MPENTPPSESPDRQDERYDRQMFRILRNIDLNLLTIFEAVYVHKGIVNAAKILNITPSAISQSINKLRALFPDPLFIRKGQGVTPTAYATHLHQYISRGMEAFLSALDITGSPHQQRVITIATTPAMGALLMPGLASALMRRMSADARRKGASIGLLTSTDAGRTVYERLGWTLLAPWTTAQLRIKP